MTFNRKRDALPGLESDIKQSKTDHLSSQFTCPHLDQTSRGRYRVGAEVGVGAGSGVVVKAEAEAGAGAEAKAETKV